MALSVEQTMSLFQILDIPYSDSYTAHDGMGTAQAYQSTFATYSTIKSEVDAFLTGLSGTVETAIIALITTWDAISLKAITMQSGAVGGISGVNIDYGAQRALVRERMENLVPFIAEWRLRIRQSASGPKPSSIIMVR